MSVRIVAGEFRGRFLQSPDGLTTHPMNERIRGSLFNIIGSRIEGAIVLDAFAGTGSLGLESLSRGAQFTTFIERDRVANKILNENVTKLKANDKSKVVRAGLRSWIDNNLDKQFDIIFADPPYNNLQLSTVAELPKILKSNGLMVLSYPGRGELPTVNGVVVVDNRSYGNAALAFYRKE